MNYLLVTRPLCVPPDAGRRVCSAAVSGGLTLRERISQLLEHLPNRQAMAAGTAALRSVLSSFSQAPQLAPASNFIATSGTLPLGALALHAGRDDFWPLQEALNHGALLTGRHRYLKEVESRFIAQRRAAKRGNALYPLFTRNVRGKANHHQSRHNPFWRKFRLRRKRRLRGKRRLRRGLL